MSPLILQIIAAMQLALKAAPAVQGLYDEFRKLVTMLFNGGLITIAQQQALMDWAEEHEKATLAGETPPEFQVEPDPE